MERLSYITSHSFKVLLSKLLSFINLDFIFYQCGMGKLFFKLFRILFVSTLIEQSVWCYLIYIVISVIYQDNTHTIYSFSLLVWKMDNFCEKLSCEMKQKNGLITELRYKFKLCLFSLHKNVHYHRFSIVTTPRHVATDQVTILYAWATSYPLTGTHCSLILHFDLLSHMPDSGHWFSSSLIFKLFRFSIATLKSTD